MLAAVAGLIFAAGFSAAETPAAGAASTFTVPVEYYKLPNGLKVVLSRDTTIDLRGLPADHLKTYVQRVYSVTPQDVQRLTQKYIQDEKATIVVVGGKEVIEEQVKEQVKPYGTIAP